MLVWQGIVSVAVIFYDDQWPVVWAIFFGGIVAFVIVRFLLESSWMKAGLRYTSKANVDDLTFSSTCIDQLEWLTEAKPKRRRKLHFCILHMPRFQYTTVSKLLCESQGL